MRRLLRTALLGSQRQLQLLWPEWREKLAPGLYISFYMLPVYSGAARRLVVHSEGAMSASMPSDFVQILAS